MSLPDLPQYTDSLADFLWALRESLGLTQEEVAELCHLDRSRITRYENPLTQDRPRPAYVAFLAVHIARRHNDAPDVCEALLSRVNHAMRLAFRRPTHADWAALAADADAFHEKQRARRTAKSPPDTGVWDAMLTRRLPPTPHRDLLGREPLRQEMLAALIGRNEHRVIAVEGLGGLGKSALLDATVREHSLGHRFESVVWVTIPQRPSPTVQTAPRSAASRVGELRDMLLHELGLTSALGFESAAKEHALASHLQRAPHLIVIDNLESAADVDALVPYLLASAHPGKALIASRHDLSAFPETLRFRLEPLPQAVAIELLRHDTALRDPGLAGATTDEQFAQIVERVGGNPMALKLIVGQIVVLSLAETLAILRRVDDEEIDEFYTHIFQRSWDALQERERTLLTVMPLAHAATYEQLSVLTSLKRSDLNAALRTLQRLLLIQPTGTLDDRRYAIHRLTELFLLKHVIGWQRSETCGRRESAAFFRQAILANLAYWRRWLTDQTENVAAWDRERRNIVKAIDFGLDVGPAWSSTHALMTAWSPYMERRGHWHEWHHSVRQAITVARQHAHEDQLPELFLLLARLARLRSQYAESARYFRRTIATARAIGDRYSEARACSNLGYHFYETGHWDRARVLCHHALAIFFDMQSAHGRAHTHNHLGLLYTAQGDLNRAHRHLEQACSIWSAMADKHGLMRGLTNLGLLYRDMGDNEQSISHFHHATDLAKETGEELTVGNILVNLASVHRNRNEVSDATTCIDQADLIFQRHAYLHGLTVVQHYRGSLLLDEGAPGKAEPYLLAAREGWRAFGNRTYETEVLLMLVRCAQMHNENERAASLLQEAEGTLDRLGASRQRAELYAEAAMLRQAILTGDAR